MWLEQLGGYFILFHFNQLNFELKLLYVASWLLD